MENKRLIAAEGALLMTMLMVAVLSFDERFKFYALILSVPFMLYSLFFIIILNKK